MSNEINYLDLLDQKRELHNKLVWLDAEQFGAMSVGEMDDIARRRRDIEAALSAIEKILNPKKRKP